MAIVEVGHEARLLVEIKGVPSETLVLDLTAHERTSAPYHCSVSLVCEDEIRFDDVVGKEALVTIRGDDEDRHLHGIVSEFQQAGGKGRFRVYRARIVPSLWLLSLEQDCRIFQNKTVQEIVTQILRDGGLTPDRFDFRLQGQYPAREYCVQYRETDLQFVSRLLEEEGIYYFFEHSKDKHVAVFADSTSAYKPIPGKADLPINVTQGMTPEEECVFGFAFSRRILSGKVTQQDFLFEKPSLDLTTQEQAASNQKLEVYDYPGRYVDQNRGKKLTQVRLQEVMAFRDKAEGQSACPRFTPGFTFKLTGHEVKDFDQEYILVDVLHTGSQPQSLQEEGGYGRGGSYSNDFLCIPSSVTLKPERISPKPIVEGVQTAIVVGPKGEEIYTDEYGRVKVQFHWDREGARDERSSCWIRVASGFAGGNYGAIFTPRVGQEVVVGFLEGDPDKPIITGRVYNADNMPPYKLPDEKTKSTVKTNSSTGGDGFNEIRFEDKKGDEQIFVHGEKDIDVRIKNDRREWIGNDRHLVVKRDKIEKVERDRHTLVDRDEVGEITRDRHLKVGGKEAVEVTGSRSVSVQGDVIDIFKSNRYEQVAQDYYLKGMNLVVEGMTGLTVKVGGNFITIDPGGIFISGKMVMVNSGGSALTGSALSAVSPAAPLATKDAADSAPGKDASYSAAQTHKEPKDEEEKEKKSWIEIELVDEEGNPVPGERYRIELPDGKIAEGTLDEKGFARVSGIEPGTCKVTFPRLDKDAWEKA